MNLDSYLYSDKYLDVVKEELDIQKRISLLDTYNILVDLFSDKELTSSYFNEVSIDPIAIYENAYALIIASDYDFINYISGSISKLVNKIAVSLDDKTGKDIDEKLISQLKQFPLENKVQVDGYYRDIDDLLPDTKKDMADIKHDTTVECEYLQKYMEEYIAVNIEKTKDKQDKIERIDYHNRQTKSTYNPKRGYTVLISIGDMIKVLEQKVSGDEIKECKDECVKIAKDNINKVKSIAKQHDMSDKEAKDFFSAMNVLCRQMITNIAYLFNRLYKDELNRRKVVRDTAKQVISNAKEK